MDFWKQVCGIFPLTQFVELVLPQHCIWKVVIYTSILYLLKTYNLISIYEYFRMYFSLLFFSKINKDIWHPFRIIIFLVRAPSPFTFDWICKYCTVSAKLIAFIIKILDKRISVAPFNDLSVCLLVQIIFSLSNVPRQSFLVKCVGHIRLHF